MNSTLRFFIPLAIAITALSGLIYLTGQQYLRQNANDPQIQSSEDIAQRLSINPALPRPTANLVDPEKSLSPFIIIFNDKNQPVFSTVKLDGKVPTPPGGVFDYTRKHNQDRFTWQPTTGVRIATVMTRYSGNPGGFVLAGRSLHEVEIREDNLLTRTAIGWIITLVGSFVATILFVPQQKRKK